MGCCADKHNGGLGHNQYSPSYKEPNRHEDDEQHDSPSLALAFAHLKRPDLKGTFSCLLCRKQFCHSSSLSRHKMQTHLRRFRCTICNKQISNNEALRAHMASEHQNGRVFLCRCCNWAFRDKNELHRHLKSRRSKEQPKGVEEGPKANSERSPIRVPFNQPSLLPSPPQDRHHLLMTNLWNNILLGQCRLQDFTAANEEDVSGRGQELPPILQPPPPMPIPSSVIVQNVAANNNISMSQSSQTGLSPSESDTELTIISSSSSSSSSHNNSHTISPSQSCSSSSAKNVPLIDQICQPPNSVSPECPQCALVKPKLALVQTRCSYLEVYNGTMQNELVRLNAKCILAEQCIRRLEMELRQWRERNDLLRYRLLECREKALSMVAGGTANGAHLELNKFVGEMLKITLV